MDSSNEKMIDIDIAEEFCCDLKFKLEPANPTPEAKFVFLPKNKDSLFEPKISLLNIHTKAQIYVPPNLNVNMEEINLLHDLEPNEEALGKEDQVILGIKRKFNENFIKLSGSKQTNCTPNENTGQQNFDHLKSNVKNDGNQIQIVNK